MHLIDSHCHLDFTLFDLDRDQILTHCEQLGVNDIIVPAVAQKSWRQLLNICEQSERLHPALGMHPMFMEQHKSEDINALQEALKRHSVIAIGEIGLDFYLDKHDKQAQIDLFTQQLDIAQHFKLPVLLHVRKAHDQVIACLKKHPVVGGIVHAFNGSFQQAESYQKLGFLFGVGGAISHPNATRLHTLMAKLPLSHLVLETDAPDMPLAGMNGARNSPENIPKILTSLAELRNESIEEIAAVTSQNCQTLLSI